MSIIQENEAKRVRAELDHIRKKLSDSDIEKIDKDAEALRRLQETPEDVSTLPTLEREDIPPSVAAIRRSGEDATLSASLYDQATSGIFYFASAFGAGTLPGLFSPVLLLCPDQSRHDPA